MEVKVERNIIKVRVKCQVCKKKHWFRYEARSGYICKACLICISRKALYWYVRCIRCGRTFYSRSNQPLRCIRCVGAVHRTTRKKWAVGAKDLIDGEMFSCWEYPNIVFIKYGGNVLHHAGSKIYDMAIVLKSNGLYKHVVKNK